MYINASEYLQDIRSTRIEIQNCSRKLKELEHLVAISGISYDREIVSSTPRKDGLENKVINHLQECEEVREHIAELLVFIHHRIDEAVNYINMIDSEAQQEVLMLRYIEHKKWSEILEIRDCDSISGQHELHRKALESLQNILDKSSGVL